MCNFTLVGARLSGLKALTVTLIGELDVLTSSEDEVLKVPTIGPLREWMLILSPTRLYKRRKRQFECHKTIRRVGKGVETYFDEDRAVERMKGDETKCVLLKCRDDMGVLGQPGLEVGNSGYVLALRKRDGDVEKQRIPISGVTYERMSLLIGSHVSTKPEYKRTWDMMYAYENSDTVAIFSTAERAQARPLE